MITRPIAVDDGRGKRSPLLDVRIELHGSILTDHQ
jgi:hypothetical protein